MRTPISIKLFRLLVIVHVRTNIQCHEKWSYITRFSIDRFYFTRLSRLYNCGRCRVLHRSEQVENAQYIGIQAMPQITVGIVPQVQLAQDSTLRPLDKSQL
jgi:hypothetical protein